MNCISCSKPLQAHSPVEEPRQPHPGDLSVCAYCGIMYIFDDHTELVACSQEKEEEIFRQHPHVREIVISYRMNLREKIKLQ